MDAHRFRHGSAPPHGHVMIPRSVRVKCSPVESSNVDAARSSAKLRSSSGSLQPFLSPSPSKKQLSSSLLFSPSLQPSCLPCLSSTARHPPPPPSPTTRSCCRWRAACITCVASDVWDRMCGNADICITVTGTHAHAQTQGIAFRAGKQHAYQFLSQCVLTTSCWLSHTNSSSAEPGTGKQAGSRRGGKRREGRREQRGRKKKLDLY